MTDEHYEWRDGRRFKVTRLPDATPPPGRSRTSRYRFEDVGKPGNLAPRDPEHLRRKPVKSPEPVEHVEPITTEDGDVLVRWTNAGALEMLALPADGDELARREDQGWMLATFEEVEAELRDEDDPDQLALWTAAVERDDDPRSSGAAT